MMNSDNAPIPTKSAKNSPADWWNGCFDTNILEYISNTNLFVLCCVAACFSLISYLAAFSCEISWVLESHGNLPTPAYLLCSGYFILFVASTILIHGLATGLSWGLFSWSIIIGCLAIPELILVMIITTQFWGLQSTHGLTELVGYIIRLIINCLALLCVIPTALRWRRERQILSQLQSLASRLQLGTPPPSSPATHHISNNIVTKDNLSRHNSRRPSRQRRASTTGHDNPAFIVHENEMPNPYSVGVYGSQNEFNASIFGLDPSYYIGSYPPPNFSTKRTQSLLDLRTVMPAMVMPNQNHKNEQDVDEVDGLKYQKNINNNKMLPNKLKKQMEISSPDPIYYTISSDKTSKPLGRNCVSLENLGGLTIKNDLYSYGNNLLQNYNPPFVFHQAFPPAAAAIYQQYPTPFQYPNHNYWTPFSGYGGYGGYTNPNPYINSRSNTNSKQSLGTTESDDYRKYRDVAL